MTSLRQIMHLDMDAFFAAIEQRDRPELRGKPILIGSDRPRGVVTTASYEARPFGCGSAQPMAVAKRRCPHAIVVPVRGAHYRAVSEQLFEILHDSAPVVEPLSVDEAFLDLTGTHRALGPPEKVARDLKQRIRDELQLVASVGIAPNKFLAKLASDLEKPDGLTVIRPDTIDEILMPLAIERLWGVGPATAKRLHALGIRTIGDLRTDQGERAATRLGSGGARLLELARGQDNRPVVPDSEAKTIGQEQTFEHDLDDPEEVRAVIREQAEQVGRRLRRHGVLARGVTVKIRFGAFETITRSTTLSRPTDLTAAIRDAGLGLFDKWVRRSFAPVRLIGVTAGRLGPAGGGQLELFGNPDDEKKRRVDAVVDGIRDKFGTTAIRRGPGRAARTDRTRKRSD